ncbi:MAG TPA: class I SAM-dependent methyltransferase [Thermoanaerobaculia bacterium]|nr:class I SAM-dependent methyltransferase [Thermoanaerobaculia bacterium]
MGTRISWDALRAIYRRLAIEALDREIGRDKRHYACNAAFALQRLEEGIELAAHFPSKYGERALSILDLGAGNGGVSVALANESRNRVVAADIVVNATATALRRETGIPFAQVVASADRLPFGDASFDVVLCLETLEHLPAFRAAAREMMRVLRPGGQVMITTPARARFLLKPDPHFAVRGLMLLPDALQRRVVVDRLRLTRDYDVAHIFWSAGSIIRAFPGRGRTETLVAIPWPGRPRNLREVLWKIFRRYLWDRIVIYRRG